MPRSLTLPLIAVLALALTACGGPRTVTLPVRGISPLNPNDAQESTPVNVKVWPLSGADRFRSATVDQLWTDAKNVLGPDLLGDAGTFTVFPGTASDPSVEHRLEVPSSTQFLGVLAMYLRSDAQDQRSTVVSIADAEEYGLMFTGFTVRVLLPVQAVEAAPASTSPPAAR